MCYLSVNSLILNDYVTASLQDYNILFNKPISLHYITFKINFCLEKRIGGLTYHR